MPSNVSNLFIFPSSLLSSSPQEGVIEEQIDTETGTVFVCSEEGGVVADSETGTGSKHVIYQEAKLQNKM